MSIKSSLFDDFDTPPSTVEYVLNGITLATNTKSTIQSNHPDNAVHC
jgi:hypothetical protein